MNFFQSKYFIVLFLLFFSVSAMASLPIAPSNLVSSNITDNTVTLTWIDNANNEDGYLVYRNGLLINYLPVSSIYYTDINLDNNTSYGYQVCAFNSDGEFCSDTIYSSTLSLQAPLNFRILQASLTKDSVTFAWSDNSQSEEGYILKENGIALPDMAANITTYTRNNLTPGLTYNYQLCIFSGNIEACTSIVSVTTLSLRKPKDLIITEITKNSLKLIWEDDSDNEDGYIIRRNGLVIYDTYAPVFNTNIFYVDVDLTSNASYLYQVCAYDYSGNEACEYKPVRTLINETPTRVLTILEDKTEITLQWQDNAGGDFKHRIKHNNIIIIDALDGDATSVVIDGLVPGTEYSFEVCAYSDLEEYCANTIYTITANISIPLLYVVGDPTNNSIEISWANTSTNETHFSVRRIGVAEFVGSLNEIADVASNISTDDDQYTYVDVISSGNEVANTSYYYQVCAINEPDKIGCSALLEVKTAPLVLTAPHSLAVVGNSTKNTIEISWVDSSTNETHFRVRRIGVADFVESLIDIEEVISTDTVGDSGLQTYVDEISTGDDIANTSYYYQVCATSDVGIGCSALLEAKTAKLPLVSPDSLAVVGNSTKNTIEISWVDSSTNETHFRVRRIGVADFVESLIDISDEESANIPGSGITQSYVNQISLGNDVANTSYLYQVCAIDSSDPTRIGCSTLLEATTAVLVLPETPTHFSVSPATATPTSIDLAWQNGGNTDSYEIERRKGVVVQSIFTIASAATTTYKDISLTADTVYNYKVCAINTDGRNCTHYLGIKTDVLPTAPANLSTASIAQTTLVLNWSDLANNETGYIVKQRLVGNGIVTDKAFEASNTQISNISGLTVSTSYEFQVCADYYGAIILFDSVTCSAILAVTTKPMSPNNGLPTGLSESSVTLNWIDLDSNESGYRIRRNGSILVDMNANSTTYTDNTVLHSTLYAYQICAYNSGGESCASAYNIETFPGTPKGISTDDVTQTSVTLKWIDIATNEIGYRIKRAGSIDVDIAANLTTYVDNVLVADTSYTYNICAYRGVNESCSANITVTTLIPAPATPTGFSIDSAPSRTSVSFYWTDNSNNEDGFRIYRDNEVIAQGSVNNLGIDSDSFTDNTLEPGVIYTYKVCAYNSGGEACDVPISIKSKNINIIPVLMYLLN